jgi:hypothetical protein
VNETTLVVDLHGSGKSWKDFSEASQVNCLEFTVVIKVKLPNYESSPDLRPICVAPDKYFRHIEYLNTAYHESLLDVLPDGYFKLLVEPRHTHVDIYYEAFFRGMDIICPVARLLSQEVAGVGACHFNVITENILQPLLFEVNEPIARTWDNFNDVIDKLFQKEPNVFESSGKLVDKYVDRYEKSHIHIKKFEKQTSVWRYTQSANSSSEDPQRESTHFPRNRFRLWIILLTIVMLFSASLVCLCMLRRL